MACKTPALHEEEEIPAMKRKNATFFEDDGQSESEMEDNMDWLPSWPVVCFPGDISHHVNFALKVGHPVIFADRHARIDFTSLPDSLYECRCKYCSNPGPTVDSAF